MMTRPTLTRGTLMLQNVTHLGTAARSQGNRGRGFRPAFIDRETGTVYDSCFADGRPAPVHLLDGLPDAVVVERAEGGRVRAAKASVEAGFTRDGCFYSRDEARRACAARFEPALAN
jgi:hypothetical protein